MELFTLDTMGIGLAIALGIAMLFLGQNLGVFFVLTMLLFLVLSTVVTHVGRGYKARLLGDEGHRGGKNVLANGLPPLIMAVLFFISASGGYERMAALSVIGFVASVSAITADKFESEIGIFADRPRLIFGFRKVKKGTSGALTLFGLGAGALGSALIAVMLLLVMPSLQEVFGAVPMLAQSAIVCAAFGGFAGSIVDSMFGYYEEKRIGNKYTSNFACGVVGGIVGMLIFALLV